MVQNVNIAIVTIAYNRPDSLSRLLDSLNRVDYEGHDVTLIISIDYSGDDSVYRLAHSFEWKFGEKKVIQHTVNLGLKKHVLTCGDMVKDYDAVIVLEDDLIVSPAMYSYTIRAVEKYKNDDNIAAIALYSKGFSETAWKPFVPAVSCYDTYFVQTAESWGQVWMRDSWKDFRTWYDNNSTPFSKASGVPNDVCDWDSKSWKKYHIKYCVDNNKYTVYPYWSLTTCMGEEGEHVKKNNNRFQVPFVETKSKEYRFADFVDESSVKYDVYLERVSENLSGICMDLYGQKTDFGSCKYVITPRVINYKVVDTYGLALRPHEENILLNVRGDYFVKYDLSSPLKNIPVFKAEKQIDYYNYIDFEYATNQMRTKDLFSHMWRLVFYRIKKLFRKK
ncbi:MAG: glycosyltransferase [Ruminococcus sp.]|nr:glycosyltransferase [Ruminococcus sp.]